MNKKRILILVIVLIALCLLIYLQIRAWKTFDWASRIRLVKSYAKVLLMQIGVTILFVIVVVIEVFAIARLDLKKILPGDGNNGSDGEI